MFIYLTHYSRFKEHVRTANCYPNVQQFAPLSTVNKDAKNVKVIQITNKTGENSQVFLHFLFLPKCLASKFFVEDKCDF